MRAALLFHIDDAGRWPTLIANLRNARTADPERPLQVIANGQAPVALWAKGHWRREMEELAAAGVTVGICQNSVRNLGLDPGECPAGSVLVPAGIIAIADAQGSGALYLKP